MATTHLRHYCPLYPYAPLHALHANADMQTNHLVSPQEVDLIMRQEKVQLKATLRLPDEPGKPGQNAHEQL